MVPSHHTDLYAEMQTKQQVMQTKEMKTNELTEMKLKSILKCIEELGRVSNIYLSLALVEA